MKRFRSLSRHKQLAIVQAYKDFVGALETRDPRWFVSTEEGRAWGNFAALVLGQPELAQADEYGKGLDCFHGGWPNQLIPDDQDKGKCPRPGRGEGKGIFDKVIAASGGNWCTGEQTPCNPVFFGKGFCFDPDKEYTLKSGSKVKGRGYTWAACSSMSTATIDQLVDGILQHPEYGEAFAAAENAYSDACKSDRVKPMCNALAGKLGQIEDGLDSVTDSTDCLGNSFAVWEGQASSGVVNHPPQGWTKKKTDDPDPALGNCADYVAPAPDGSKPIKSWCYGLPSDYSVVAYDDNAANLHGVVIASSTADYGIQSATFLPGPTPPSSDADHQKQIKALLSLPEEDFNKALKASGAQPMDYRKIAPLEAKAAVPYLKQLTTLCKDGKPEACTSAISSCSKLKDSDVQAALKVACKDAQFASLDECKLFASPSPSSGSQSGTAGAAGH